MTTFLNALDKYESTHPLGMITYVGAYNIVALAVAAANAAKSVDGSAMAKALEAMGIPGTQSGIIGPSELYSTTNHFLQFQRSDFTFIPASPDKSNGFLVPAQ